LNIQIKVSERIFLKDPESSELGKKIVSQGICLIDKMGFEHFTFKKLAEHIQSTEASVYRYFENKHKLLIYLLSWYWNWLEHRLSFGLYNVQSPHDRLQLAISIFSHTENSIPDFTGMDTQALYRIVVAESPKAYLTKEVDADNKEGYFLSYKRFCKQVASIIQEINPDYRYATALVSTAVESAHNQKYFSEHLPSLTEVSKGRMEEVADFLTEMIFNVIRKLPEKT